MLSHLFGANHVCVIILWQSVDVTRPSGDPGIGLAPRAAVRACAGACVRASPLPSFLPSFLARDRLQLVISENPLSSLSSLSGRIFSL